MRRNDDEAVPLDAAIDNLVRSLQGGRADASSAGAIGGLFGRWDDIVGDAMARHVQPVRLDGDRLVLAVDEPAWATQVRLLTDQLRARIAAEVAVHIETIEVRVSGRH